MFVLKLPPFFTGLNGERKRAAISKLTFIWTLSSRSYIVFALGHRQGTYPYQKLKKHYLLMVKLVSMQKKWL